MLFRSKTLIFPRYHQLDVVRKLLVDVRQNGAGQDVYKRQVLDNKYSAYFGFTADEVMEMAEYYGAADKYDEICRWYDGYRFGKTEIFNPWSVVNYFSNECEPRPFWVSTGSNDIIGEVLAQADEEIYNRLTSLCLLYTSKLKAFLACELDAWVENDPYLSPREKQVLRNQRTPQEEKTIVR